MGATWLKSHALEIALQYGGSDASYFAWTEAINISPDLSKAFYTYVYICILHIYIYIERQRCTLMKLINLLSIYSFKIIVE